MGYKIDDSYLNREVTQDGVAPLTNPQSYEEAILNNATWGFNVGDKVGKFSRKYDTQIGDISSMSPEDVDSERARIQTTMDRIGNAAINNLAIAGSTGIGSSLGFVYGLFDALANGEIDRIWNNEITNAVDKFQKDTQENFSIYRDQNFQDQSVWKKLGTSVFWADLIQNLGYAEGMMIPGLGTSNLLSSAPKMIQKIGGALAGALAEASTEAIQAKNNKIEEERRSLDMNYNKLYLQTSSDEERQQLGNLYTDSLNRIEDDSNKAGNFVFGYNTALLTFTNLIEWGNVFSRGNKSALKNSSKLRQELANTKSKGITFDKAANKFNIEGKGATIAKSVGEKALNVFSEGFEEVAQDIGQNTAFNNSDYSTFNEMSLNPIYMEKADGVLNSFVNSLSEAMKDPETAYTFSLGALTSIVGTPSLKKYTTKNGKTFIAPTIEGGVINFTKDVMSDLKDYNIRSKAVEEANALINNDKTNEMYKGLIRSMSLDDAINKALMNNDKFDYENFKLAKEVSGLITLYNIGHTEIIDDIIDKTSTISDDEVQELINDGVFGDTTMSVDNARDVINRNAERLKKLNNDFAETLTSIEASEQGQKLSKEQKENFIYGKLQIQSWNERINSLAEELNKFYSIFGSNVSLDDFKKSLLNSSDFLKDFRYMISGFDRSVYNNSKQENNTAITPEYIDDLKSKLDDIIKIKDAIYNYSTEMNKVWSNPLTALEESKYELGNKIYKVFKEKKIDENKELADSIISAQTFSEALNRLFITANTEETVKVTDSQTRNFILDSLYNSGDPNIIKAVKTLDSAMSFIDFVSDEIDDITGTFDGAKTIIRILGIEEYSDVNELKNFIKDFIDKGALNLNDEQRQELLNKIDSFEVTKQIENSSQSSSERSSRFFDLGEGNEEGEEVVGEEEGVESSDANQIAFDKMSLQELKDYIYNHNLQNDIPDVDADDLSEEKQRLALIDALENYYELNGEGNINDEDSSPFEELFNNSESEEKEDEKGSKDEKDSNKKPNQVKGKEDTAEGDEGIYIAPNSEETDINNGVDISKFEFIDPNERNSGISGDIKGSEENDMVTIPEDAYSVGRLSSKYDITKSKKHIKEETEPNWQRTQVIDLVNEGLGTKTPTLEDYINSGRLAERKHNAEAQGHKLPIHFIMRRHVEGVESFATTNTLFAAVEEQKEYANITAYDNAGNKHYFRVLGVVSAPKTEKVNENDEKVKVVDPDLKAFKEACKKATSEIRTKKGTKHSFTVAPYTSNLEHIFSGRLVTSENGKKARQRDLRSIVKEEDYKDINIAVKAGNIELTIGDKLDGRTVDININNPNDRRGTVWLKVKEGDGNIYYKNIRLKRFNKSFYESLSKDEISNNEVLKKIMNLCYTICSNSDNYSVVNSALSKLHAYLYIPKGKKISVLTKLNQVVIGSSRIDFSNNAKSDAMKLFNLIMEQNYRFSIGLADLSLKQLIDSNIFTTDLTQVHNINHSFLISEMFPSETDSGTTVFLPKDSTYVTTIDIHTGNKDYIEGRSSSYAKIGDTSYYKNDDGTYDRIIEEKDGVEKRERLNPNKETDRRAIAIIDGYFKIKNKTAKDSGYYLDKNYKHRIYQIEYGSTYIYLAINPDTSTNNLLTIREVSPEELTELKNEIRKRGTEKEKGKESKKKKVSSKKKREDAAERIKEALLGKDTETSEEEKEETETKDKKPKASEVPSTPPVSSTPKQSRSRKISTRKPTNKEEESSKEDTGSSPLVSKYRKALTNAVRSNKAFIKAVREGEVDGYSGMENIGEIVDKMLQDKDMIDILGDMEANEITEDSINQYRETKKKCGR